MKKTLAILLVILSLLTLLSGCRRSVLNIDSSESMITVTMENTAKDAYGFGTITFKEGQKMEIRVSLQKSIPIRIEVHPAEGGAPVFQSIFYDGEGGTFDVPAGDYNVRFGPVKGATGTMTIKAS
ncbi:MAG: hypothetical protein J6P31_06980 [Oscillospiraceae bacterium]|nr:hypothetical protein [Oscillospiraceae bacterium]